MRRNSYKLITFLLALLIAVSSWLPGRAEAQMRCAGASPQSVPCVRAELPATGVSDKQVYSRLMSCCRSMQASCPMGQGGSRQRSAQAAAHRTRFSAPRCLVAIRVTTVPRTLAAPRSRWMLTSAPALAPPVTVQSALCSAPVSLPIFWTYSPVLSPHAAPRLHGLRAPPVASERV